MCCEKLQPGFLRQPAIIVLLVCPAWLSFDTPSAAVGLLFSFPDPYVPYDLCAVWKIAPVTADFWAPINVSVSIKGETLTSVCEK